MNTHFDLAALRQVSGVAIRQSIDKAPARNAADLGSAMATGLCFLAAWGIICLVPQAANYISVVCSLTRIRSDAVNCGYRDLMMRCSTIL